MGRLRNLTKRFGRRQSRDWNWQLSTHAAGVSPPKGKVVINFTDGSELVLQATDPLCRDFVRAVDNISKVG